MGGNSHQTSEISDTNTQTTSNTEAELVQMFEATPWFWIFYFTGHFSSTFILGILTCLTSILAQLHSVMLVLAQPKN